MKTLINGAVVLTCDERHSVLMPGDVVLDGGLIDFVGTSYNGDYDLRLSGAGRLLMPGLVNAHTHSAMSIFRGLADDDDLMAFLADRVWPRETNLRGEDVYAGSLLASVEMLKSGVTTSVDMYFHEEDLARAAVDSGIRSMITPTLLDLPLWTPILGGWETQLERAIAFCRKWEGSSGRIHTGLGPHAPYTVTLETLSLLAGEARALGVPVNIHLVETESEQQTFNERGLGSTAQALENIGFFEGPVIAAHSIWIDDGDIAIYREHAVGVAHCPQSNAKLAAGVAPVVAMLRGGVNVALGTDGAATNNNYDLWEDLRLAPLLQKVRSGDPKDLTAEEALWMATAMGARAIGMPGLGVLREGARADVIMLDLADTVAVPIFGPQSYISHAVYAFGSQMVDSVWVEGVRVVKGGEILTVDEERVRHAAQRAAINLAKRTEAATG